MNPSKLLFLAVLGLAACEPANGPIEQKFDLILTRVEKIDQRIASRPVMPAPGEPVAGPKGASGG